MLIGGFHSGFIVQYSLGGLIWAITLQKYLGHMVGSGKLHVDHYKVAAVSSWEPPTNVKGV